MYVDDYIHLQVFLSVVPQPKKTVSLPNILAITCIVRHFHLCQSGGWIMISQGNF